MIVEIKKKIFILTDYIILFSILSYNIKLFYQTFYYA